MGNQPGRLASSKRSRESLVSRSQELGPEQQHEQEARRGATSSSKRIKSEDTASLQDPSELMGATAQRSPALAVKGPRIMRKFSKKKETELPVDERELELAVLTAPGQPRVLSRSGTCEEAKRLYNKASEHSVVIRWDAPQNATNNTGYQLEASYPDGLLWVPVAEPVIGETTRSVTDLTPGQTYIFRVTARNKRGSSAPSPASEPVLVSSRHKDGKEAPSFLVKLQERVCKEHETAEFSVKFRGHPLPSVQWYRDQEPITSDSRTKVLTVGDGSELVITDCVTSDTGRIRCRITNAVSSDITETSLMVTAPPRIQLPDELKAGVTLPVGSTISLSLPYTGLPLPLFTWYRDKDVLASQNDSRVTTQHTEKDVLLRISEAECSDSGVYRLRAVNQTGSHLVTFNVSVTGAPDRPGQPRLCHLATDSATIEWTPPANNGGAVVSNYVVEYFRDGWEVWLKAASTSGTTARVEGLSPGARVKFRVKAENAHGLGRPSAESGAVTVPGTAVCSGEVDTKRNVQPAVTDPRDRVVPLSRRTLADVGRSGSTERPLRTLLSTTTSTSQEAESLPHLSTTSAEVVAAQGVTTHLIVTVQGNPDFITWRYEDVPLVEDDHYHVRRVAEGSQLTIANTSIDDAGVYTAVAGNQAGQSQIQIQLRVHARPGRLQALPQEHLQSPQSQSAASESSRCRPMEENRGPQQAPPPQRLQPTQTLSGAISRSRSAEESVDGAVAVAGVPQLQRAVSTEGQRLTDRDTASRIERVGRFLRRRNSAVFARTLDDVTAQPGGGVSLRAELAAGYRDSRVQWFHNGSAVLPSGRYRITSQSGLHTLEILSVTPHDVGRWSCSLPEMTGAPSTSATLFVAGGTDGVILEASASMESLTASLPSGLHYSIMDSPVLSRRSQTPRLPTGERGTAESIICSGLQPPMLTESLYDRKVKVGDKMVLTVTASDPDRVRSVQWLHKGKPVVTDDLHLSQFDGVASWRLVVESTDLTDDSEWRAVLTSDRGVTETWGNVILAVPRNYRRPRFMETLRALLTDEGLVSFECKVVGYPTPQLRWFKDGQELRPGDVYQLSGTNSLGVYACLARNCMGKAESTAELALADIENQLTEDERRRVQRGRLPPSFVQQLPPDTAVRLGQAHSFMVEVKSYPKPEVTWYHDSVLVNTVGTIEVIRDAPGMYRLNFQPVKLTHQGEWQCVAENPVGRAVSICYLTVEAPRHFRAPHFLQPLRASLTETGTVDLECKVIGTPQPVLRWYKDGKELKAGDIRRITSGSDGADSLGVYTCEACNCMGVTRSSASLFGMAEGDTSPSMSHFVRPDLPPHIEHYGILRELSLSTINEERTSQLMSQLDSDCLQSTCLNVSEVSVTMDGRQMPVSMYGSEHLSQHEVQQVMDLYGPGIYAPTAATSTPDASGSDAAVLSHPSLRVVVGQEIGEGLQLSATVIDLAVESVPSPAEDDTRTEIGLDELELEQSRFIQPAESELLSGSSRSSKKKRARRSCTKVLDIDSGGSVGSAEPISSVDSFHTADAMEPSSLDSDDPTSGQVTPVPNEQVFEESPPESPKEQFDVVMTNLQSALIDYDLTPKRSLMRRSYSSTECPPILEEDESAADAESPVAQPQLLAPPEPSVTSCRQRPLMLTPSGSVQSDTDETASTTAPVAGAVEDINAELEETHLVAQAVVALLHAVVTGEMLPDEYMAEIGRELCSGGSRSVMTEELARTRAEKVLTVFTAAFSNEHDISPGVLEEIEQLLSPEHSGEPLTDPAKVTVRRLITVLELASMGTAFTFPHIFVPIDRVLSSYEERVSAKKIMSLLRTLDTSGNIEDQQMSPYVVLHGYEESDDDVIFEDRIADLSSASSGTFAKEKVSPDEVVCTAKKVLTVLQTAGVMELASDISASRLSPLNMTGISSAPLSVVTDNSLEKLMVVVEAVSQGHDVPDEQLVDLENTIAPESGRESFTHKPSLNISQVLSFLAPVLSEESDANDELLDDHTPMRVEETTAISRQTALSVADKMVQVLRVAMISDLEPYSETSERSTVRSTKGATASVLSEPSLEKVHAIMAVTNLVLQEIVEPSLSETSQNEACTQTTDGKCTINVAEETLHRMITKINDAISNEESVSAEVVSDMSSQNLQPLVASENMHEVLRKAAAARIMTYIRPEQLIDNPLENSSDLRCHLSTSKLTANEKVAVGQLRAILQSVIIGEDIPSEALTEMKNTIGLVSADSSKQQDIVRKADCILTELYGALNNMEPIIADSVCEMEDRSKSPKVAKEILTDQQKYDTAQYVMTLLQTSPLSTSASESSVSELCTRTASPKMPCFSMSGLSHLAVADKILTAVQTALAQETVSFDPVTQTLEQPLPQNATALSPEERHVAVENVLAVMQAYCSGDRIPEEMLSDLDRSLTPSVSSTSELLKVESDDETCDVSVTEGDDLLNHAVVTSAFIEPNADIENQTSRYDTTLTAKHHRVEQINISDVNIDEAAATTDNQELHPCIKAQTDGDIIDPNLARIEQLIRKVESRQVSLELEEPPLERKLFEEVDMASDDNLSAVSSESMITVASIRRAPDSLDLVDEGAEDAENYESSHAAIIIALDSMIDIVCNSSVATECAKNRYETIFSQSADLLLERLDALFDLSFLTGIRGLLVELSNKLKFIDDVLQRLPNNERLQGALEGVMPIVKRTLFHKVEGSVGKLKKHVETMVIAHREADQKALKESSVAAEQEIKSIINDVEEANKTKLQALKFPVSDMSLSCQFADFVDASAGMAETVKKAISSPISGSVEVGLHTTAVQQALASIVVTLTDLVQNQSLRDEALKLMAHINGSIARIAEVAEVSTICIKADDSQEMKLAAEIVLGEIHKDITVSSNRFKNTLKEVSDEIQLASDRTPEDGIQKYLMMGEKLDRECENITSVIKKTTEKKQDVMAKSKAMGKIGMESLESITKVGCLTKNLAHKVAANTNFSDVGMTATLKQAEAAIERLTQKFVNSLAVPPDKKELLSETLRKVKFSMGRLVDVGSKINFPLEADENLASKSLMVSPTQAKTVKDIENIAPSFESVIKEMRVLLVASRPTESLQQFFEVSKVLLSSIDSAEKSALKCVELSPLPERRIVGTEDTSACVIDRHQSSPVDSVKQSLSDTSNVLHFHVSSLIDALDSGSNLHSPDAAVNASLRVAEVVRRYIQDASLCYGTEFPAEKMKQVSKTFDKLNSTLRQAGIEAEEKVGWVPPQKVSSDLDIAGSVFRQAIQNMTILIEECSGSATDTRRLIDVQLYNVKVAVDKLGSAVELYISSLRDCVAESAALTLPEVSSPSPDIVVTQQDEEINSTVERYLQAVRDVIATVVQIGLRGSLADADRILSSKVGDMKTKTTDLVSMFSPDSSESIKFVSRMTEAADIVLDIARHAPKFTMVNRTQEASLLVADLREHDRGSENAVEDFCVSLAQSKNDSARVFAEKGCQVAQCLINMSNYMKNHVGIHRETTCSQSPSDADLHAKHVKQACDHLEVQGNSFMYMLENLNLTSADNLCDQTESVYEAIMALIIVVKNKSNETMSSELLATCGTLRSALEPLSSLLAIPEDRTSLVERANLLARLRKAFMTLIDGCRKSVRVSFGMKDSELDCWISHITNSLCRLSSKELCSLKQGDLVKDISLTSHDDVGSASTMNANCEDIGIDDECQLEEDRQCEQLIKPTTLAQCFTAVNPNLYPAVESSLSPDSTSAISELKMHLAELEQLVQLSVVDEEKPVHGQNQQIISLKTVGLQNQLSELSCMTNDGKTISLAQDKLIARKANTIKALATEISELIRDNYKQTKAINRGSDCSYKSNSIVSTQSGLPSVCRRLNECTESFTGALIDALSSKPSPGVLRACAVSAGRIIEELNGEIEREYPSDSINAQLQEFTDVLVKLASSVEDSSQTFDDSTPLDNRVLEELVAPGIMDVSSNLHSMRDTVTSFTTQLCDMPSSDFCIIANQHVDLIKGAAFNISQAVYQVGLAISDAAEKSRNEDYEIPNEEHEVMTSKIPDAKQYPEYSGAEEAQMNPENIINMMSVIGSLKLLKGLALESVGLKDDVRKLSDAAVAANDIDDCSSATGHAYVSTINEIQAVCSSVNSDVEHLCRSMRNIASGKSNSSPFENLLIDKISELQDALLVVTAVADQMAEAQPQLMSDVARVRNRVESLTSQTDKILVLNADKADIACSLQVAMAECMPIDEDTKDRLKSMCGAVSSALEESQEAETLDVESALASEAPALLEMLMHPEKATLLQDSESLNMDLGDWQPLETIVEEVKDDFETKSSVEDDEENRLSPRTGVSPTVPAESWSATDERSIFPSKQNVAGNDVSDSVPELGIPDRTKPADVDLDGSMQSSHKKYLAENDQQPFTAKIAPHGMKERSNAFNSETLLSKHPGKKSIEDNVKISLGALIWDSEDVAGMSKQVECAGTSPGAQTSKAFSTLTELVTNAICGESVTIKEVKTTAENVHKSLISLAVTSEEKHSVPKLVELVNKVDQHISSVTDVLEDIIRSVRGTKLATKLQKERIDDMVLPSAKLVVKHIGKLNESVQKMTSSIEISEASNIKSIFEAGVASINDNISVLSSAITKTNTARIEAIQAMKDLETKLVVAERTLDLQNGLTELLSSIELGITDREPGAEAVVDLHARSSRHLACKLVTAVTVVTGDRSSAERAQVIIDKVIADVTGVAMDIIQQMNTLTLKELVTCDNDYLPRVEMMQELMLEAAGILADLATCVEATPMNEFSALFLDTVQRLVEVKDDLCEAMKNVKTSHKVATARYNSSKSRVMVSEELSECHKSIDTFTQLLRNTLQLGDSSRHKAINREAAMFPTVTENFFACLEDLNQLDPTVRDLTLSVASCETMKEGVELLCRCVKQLAHAIDKLPSGCRLTAACGLEESCQAMSSLCGKLIERVNTGNSEQDVTIHETTNNVSKVVSLCLKSIRNELKEIDDESEASNEVNRVQEKQQRLQAQINEANEMEAKRVAGEEELKRKLEEKRRILEEIENQKESEELIRREEEILARKHRKDQLEKESLETDYKKLEHDLCVNTFNSDPSEVSDFAVKNENTTRNSTVSKAAEVVDIESTVESSLKCSAEHDLVSSDKKRGESVLNKPVAKSQKELCESSPTSITHSERKLSPEPEETGARSENRFTQNQFNVIDRVQHADVIDPKENSPENPVWSDTTPTVSSSVSKTIKHSASVGKVESESVCYTAEVSVIETPVIQAAYTENQLLAEEANKLYRSDALSGATSDNQNDGHFELQKEISMQSIPATKNEPKQEKLLNNFFAGTEISDSDKRLLDKESGVDCVEHKTKRKKSIAKTGDVAGKDCNSRRGRRTSQDNAIEADSNEKPKNEHSGFAAAVRCSDENDNSFKTNIDKLGKNQNASANFVSQDEIKLKTASEIDSTPNSKEPVTVQDDIHLQTEIPKIMKRSTPVTIQIDTDSESRGPCTDQFASEGPRISSTRIAPLKRLRWRSELQDRGAPVGSSVKLQCTIVCEDEDLRVEWFHGDSRLHPGRDSRMSFSYSAGGVASLEISDVAPEDSGEFSCRASNSHGNILSTSKLRVTSKPHEPPAAAPMFTTGIRVTYKLEEDMMSVECQLTGYPLPKVKWLRDDVVIRKSGRYRYSAVADSGIYKLLIHSPRETDSGTYKCVAENRLDRVFTSQHISVPPRRLSCSPETEIPGAHRSTRPPTFLEGLKDISTQEGQSVKLNVKVDGLPPPAIFTDSGAGGVPFTPSYGRLVDRSVPSLSLCAPVWRRLGVVHPCIVFVSRRHCANIAPVQSPFMPDYYHGKHLRRRLRSVGLPTPEVTWLLNGQHVVQSDRLCPWAQFPEYSLSVEKITSVDTGRYTCSATNTAGHSSSSAYVTFGGLDRRLARIVEKPEDMIYVPNGGDVTLSCRIVGEPSPNVGLHKGRHDVLASHRCQLEKDGEFFHMRMQLLQYSDSGTYCIRAENQHGHDRCYVLIRVKDPGRAQTPDWQTRSAARLMAGAELTRTKRFTQDEPGPLASAPRARDVGPDWVSLCWSRPLDSGGAPVLSYRVDAWLKCENAMWETMATSLICSTELYGLKSGRQYIFRVTARNKYGWGEGASSEVVTIGAPRDPPVFSKPLSPVTKALLAGMLVLECQVEAQPPAEAQWHHEGVPIGSRRRRVRTARDGATCRLSIAELRPSDSGSYSCVATSAAGESTSCTRLLVVERELLLDADVTISRALDSVISCDGSDRPLAPFFLLRPRGRRAEAGCSVRLTCQVAGRPRPQVTWLQHSQTIRRSERFSMWKEEHDFFTLEIYPVKFGDVGDYSVVAGNSYGKVVCNFMLVVDAGTHVYRAPVLVRPLCEILKADQGSNVTLEARSVAFPALSILWYRDGHRLRQSRDQRLLVSDDGLATLQLNRLQLCQSGSYSCTMTNEAGCVATSCRLLVQLPADRVDDGPAFLRVPASSHVLEGDPVTLTCEVTGRPPPQVTWHCIDSKGSGEDAPVSFSLVEGNTYRLRLSEVSLRDSGSYTVVAANEHGSVKTEVSLQVSTADTHCEESQRQRSDGQCFVSELQDLRCCDGDSVTFQTQLVNCAEPRTILWQKDGQVLENCKDFQQSFEAGVARLCIAKVYPEDQGQYVCVVADNKNAARSVTSRACLIVDDPEDDAHVTRMLATREGSPPPPAVPARTLTTLPTAALRTTPTRHLTAASSGLRHSATRTRAVSEQPCTGRLRGSLSTSGAASTALTSARTRRLLESPRFYATPHDKSAEEGESVTFKCSVSGNPSPTTVWQHDTLTIRNTDKYRVTEVGDERVLVIRNVRKTDSGLYRVALQNSAGRTHTSCRLIVLGKPASHVAGRSGSGGRDGTGRHGGSGGSRAPRPRSSALRHLSGNTTGGTESSYHPTSRLWHCNTEIIPKLNKPLKSGDTRAVSVNGGVMNGHQTAAPVFVCPLRDLRVTEGSPARLEVVVTGSAPLNVVWLRGSRNTPLPDCADFRHCSLGKKRALLIADSYLEDRGHYCCRVSNAHGTATSRAYLSVVDAGDSNMSSCEELSGGHIGSSDSGQQVEAPCGSAVRFWVRRKEGTTVEWSIAGRKAKQLESQRIQIRSSGDCHALEVIELCQSDQGAVEVTVRGPGVTWSGAVQMHVNPPADVTDSTCQSLAAEPCDVSQREEPSGTIIESAIARPADVTREAGSNGEWRSVEPHILEGPVSVSVLLGQTALLQCLVAADMTDSQSRPQVIWSKSGCALESGGRICVDTTRSGVSTLTIDDVTMDDAGKYLVRAGSDQRWASLAVEGPPEAPAGVPHLTRNNTQSLTLSWCGPAYDGGSVVTDYCVEVAPPSLPAPSISPVDWRVLAPRCRSTSLAVVMATAGVDVGWRFRVRAINKHGCSQPSREVALLPSSSHNGLPSSSVAVHSTGADDCHDVDVPAPFEHRTVSVVECEDFKSLFDVQEELGKGRFGTVYKVVENETGNRYAAKFIKCIRSTDRSKVEDEIAIMNELLHPRLLQLAAAYHSGRQMIMLLEYVSGGELFERVVADDFTLTEHECALFMQQICSGVQHMHRVSIMHLDLKPENILCLTKTSHRIKIIDFGLARRHIADQPTRVMLGTPEFIPPEIISYEPISPRSDMWSVGVICYILLSGLSPFMGDSDAETFANITRADYDFDDDAFDSVSDAAKQFITGLLHARQDKRMSAEEASAHAWVTAGQARHKATVICKEKLKKFIIRRKWQKTGNAIRALGRMSASLPHRRASQLQQQTSAVSAAASCRLQLKRSSVYSDRSDSGFSECSSVASAQTQHGARRRYTAETALTEEAEPLEDEEERGPEKQREQVSSSHVAAVSKKNCLTACCAIPEDAAAAAVIASRRIKQGTS